MSRSFGRFSVALLVVVSVPVWIAAQGGRGGTPPSEDMRAAQQAMRDGQIPAALASVRKELTANPNSTSAANMLDVLGAGAEARVVFQRIADTAATPAAKAAAHRGMAMSYAFDGDCANAIKYEEMVIAYWVTREQAEPQNAFYQQGEMANEAARVCIDQGQLDQAEKYYRRGSELGLKEPEPKTHPKSLWDFRLTHALARLAARRGNAAEANRQLAEARRILDSDKTMAEAQERFYPYLQGYVALYLNNNSAALTILEGTVTMSGNATDPFMHALLGIAHEKLGHADQAKEFYTKAYGLATGHNPPAAFTRPFAAKKLGLIK